MSVIHSVQLGLLTHSLHRQSPSSSPIPTHNIRSSSITLSSATTQRSIGVFRSESEKIRTHQEPQIQPLIDVLRKGKTGEGKAVHGLSIKFSFVEKEKMILFNHIAHMYLKCSDFETARQVFEEMPQRNVFSWTVMIVGLTESGLFVDGIRYFIEMQNSGIQPDKFAYSALVQACIELRGVELGRMVHAQVLKAGLSDNVVVSTSLLNMYAKCGEIEDSVKVFNCMDDHNEVSWNAMISGFALNGCQVEAFIQFLRMKRDGFIPNVTTFGSVLKAVGKLGDVSRGREVHDNIIELGIDSNVRVGTALIDMYSKCGCLEDAKLVFDKHFGDCRLNMPWNAMISGYSQGGYSEEALGLFGTMCLKNVESDVFTYASVFNAIADLECLKFGREVHAMVVKFGYDLQVLSLNNAIADTYSKCGCLEDAEKVFERMEERDVVTWTTMINAYTTCLEEEKALRLLSWMRMENVTPNEWTFAGLLTACASLGLLEYGRQIHGLLCKDGLDNHGCIESSLIDMYAKCGSILEAEKVFEGIITPDVVSWTAIISGYAQHGSADRALELFGRMQETGVKANEVTLLCVLFACSHGGMVEEGLNYFQSMEERYSLVPKMEHYACVVDLLGRVGCLDDAREFINDMPIEPTDMVWQTLLAACRVHRNIELGEIAAKKIFSIRPNFSATYVLLSNTYTEKGSLEDAQNLRNVMRDRGVKKEPGISWISESGTIHKFFSRDENHSQKEAIYAVLEELRENMKAMGYVPNLRYALQDMQ